MVDDHTAHLPMRPSSHKIAQIAEQALEAALNESLFFPQAKDRNDYGTDFQLEVLDGGSATNVRIHVQLKGTESQSNMNSPLRVSVRRANLNYLLVQPDSIYVCFDATTKRLLVRSAQDVFREYEHRNEEWVLPAA